MQNISPHTYHIPVLGICFSVDTPLKVARFGINSVVSVIDDELLENLREHYCRKFQLAYLPIAMSPGDYRSERITAYLDMLHVLVLQQTANLKAQPFESGSDICEYFEMLPDHSPLREQYLEILEMEEGDARSAAEDDLRSKVIPGSIDVNIMAKLDNARYTPGGEKMADEYSDAMSALRGFARSRLSSAVVFSAGYNPRLYAYAEQFDDFFPDETGNLCKRIILKVSDYRSALVQGKIFAKKGLWVSEFRIESGLNCGGHAFATDGLLMGPILEEFRQSRTALQQELAELCNKALTEKGRPIFPAMPIQNITAQGGIGTAEEQDSLLSWYELDATGWGSPFLLVPEVTNVENHTLEQLASAVPEDYYVSNASPLGVPFNNFRKSTSEAQRKARIEKRRAGSPCYKKYLSSNTEYTEQPICTASRQYIDLKEKELRSLNLPEERLTEALYKIAEKDCLCEGLTASARLKNELPLPHKLSAVAICPGPNLAFFSGIFSLKEMTAHIYGRMNLGNSLDRPHMFINELKLYVEYLKNQMAESASLMNDKKVKYFERFRANLQSGIEYYKGMLPAISNKPGNILQLIFLENQLAGLTVDTSSY
jgi:hypothetical protein